MFQPCIFYVLKRTYNGNQRAFALRETLHKHQNKDFLYKFVFIVRVLHTKPLCSWESRTAMIGIVWLFAWRREETERQLDQSCTVFGNEYLMKQLRNLNIIFRLMTDVFVKYRLKGPLQYKYSCFSSCRKYQYNQSLVFGGFLEWTVNELQCFSFINYMISHAPKPRLPKLPQTQRSRKSRDTTSSGESSDLLLHCAKVFLHCVYVL